jgi:hypothetical protein
MDRGLLQVVHASMSPGEIHHGYERQDVPKENKLVGHFNGTLKFYISCRCQIIEHTDAHAHFKSPLTKWWMIMLAITLAINKINKIVV